MKHYPFEESILEATKNARLTDAERARMRAALLAYMADYPRDPKHVGILSPYQKYLRHPAIAGAAALLIICGGSVAYAAQGTLPGDALYPVKVDVVEPLQTALTFSASAQAAWHTTLAERRVDEASTLAEEGRLSTTTETMLVANFNYNAQAADTSTASSTALTARLSVDKTALTHLIQVYSFGAHASSSNSVVPSLPIRRPHIPLPKKPLAPVSASSTATSTTVTQTIVASTTISATITSTSSPILPVPVVNTTTKTTTTSQTSPSAPAANTPVTTTPTSPVLPSVPVVPVLPSLSL